MARNDRQIFDISSDDEDDDDSESDDEDNFEQEFCSDGSMSEETMRHFD